MILTYTYDSYLVICVARVTKCTVSRSMTIFFRLTLTIMQSVLTRRSSSSPDSLPPPGHRPRVASPGPPPPTPGTSLWNNKKIVITYYTPRTRFMILVKSIWNQKIYNLIPVDLIWSRDISFYRLILFFKQTMVAYIFRTEKMLKIWGDAPFSKLRRIKRLMCVYF